MADGGTKDDKNKIRLELLSFIAFLKIAKVMGKGSKKYKEDHNWRKGLKWSRVIGACLRHIAFYCLGQDKDLETGESHLAHAGCCIMFLLEYEETHKELDDRYKLEGLATILERLLA